MMRFASGAEVKPTGAVSGFSLNAGVVITAVVWDELYVSRIRLPASMAPITDTTQLATYAECRDSMPIRNAS